MLAIKALQRTTLLDYPGKVACIVFLGGCNFRCPFCQNPELVLWPGKLPTITEDDFFKFLKNRIRLLDGVVITGGEPTLYNDLPNFAKKIKDLGFFVKLDTNGTNPEMVENVIKDGLIDYVAMDYKGPLEKYNQYTGVASQGSTLRSKIEPYKKTIKILLKRGIEFELRTTVVPTLHTKKDLVEMAQQLNNLAMEQWSNVKWYLQNFSPQKCLDPKFEKIKPYAKDFYSKILLELRRYIPKTEVRGI